MYSNIVGHQIGLDKLVRVALPFAIYNTCFSPFVYNRFYKSSTQGILKRNTSA
jgi:hypothetical protein